MLRNYTKIAWRNIVKNPFYSLVNIVGLSAGIAFTLLIASYVWSELQVNSGLKNADRQFIIQSKWKDANLGLDLTTLGPLAKEMKQRYPALIANYYRWDGVTSNISKGDKAFREGIQICDSTMLNMYGFKLKHGNPQTAFEGPYSVVITSDKARKYFGKTDVVGQTLTIESFSGSKHDFIITGVMDKPYKNSATWLTEENDNQFYISSNNISFFGRNMDWPNAYIVGYLELQPGVKKEEVEKLLQHVVKQNAPQSISENMTPYLSTLKDFYFNWDNGLVKKLLYALSGIAFFILLMAVINFINMSVSRSASRMKEIGIRKVLGSLKKQLILQFLTESVLLTSCATLLAFMVYVLTRDLFSNILGKEMPSLLSFPLQYVFFPIVLVLFVGFIAGIYPAFVLSSLKSVESLKGKLTTVKENVLLRKSLVGFQFSTATIVFIGAIIISRQISLFFSKDLGYNKDFIVSAQLPRNWTPEGVRRMEILRKQFSAMPQVKNISLSFEVPDGANGGSNAIYKSGSDTTTAIAAAGISADENYISTFEIPLAGGKFLTQPRTLADSLQVVINETQSKAMGWKTPMEAVGQRIKFVGGNGAEFTIVGVTKDFHFGTMQKAIQPITFLHVGITNVYRFFSFKLKPGDITNTMAALQKQWSALLPGTPFEYKFMDETLQRVYKSELQLKKAAYTATVLSAVIVLLGVLGLIALSVQKRTKEIGIRKVLGSSVKGIIVLFIKEFLSIILIAGLAACPIAYLLMKNWLSDYAYRVEMTAIPFIVSIGLLGMVTALLIAAQTIKTALANPVKALRTE